MKAMIFAAGRGTRLGDLTDSIPKPLVTVGGVPILGKVIEKLKDAGVVSIMINLHYLSEQIKEYVLANDSFGINIHYSEEEKLLDTGGGLREASFFFEDSEHFLVHNADVYCELDIDSFFKQHIESNHIASLAIQKRKTDRVLLFDRKLHLSGWRNRTTQKEGIIRNSEVLEEFGFSGIHAVSKKLFKYLDSYPEEVFSIMTGYFQAVSEGEVVGGVDIQDAAWFDMGTPAKLAELNSYLRSK